MTYFEQTNRYMKFNRTILFLLIAACSLSQAIAQNNKPKATIDHVAIFVVDLQKEQAFYRDIIQLDTLAEPFHDNKHAWFSIGNGIAMHIIQGAQQPKEVNDAKH